MPATYTTSADRIHRPSGSLHWETFGDGAIIDSKVFTKHGIVSVYATLGEHPRDDFVMMRFAIGGWEYSRRWEKQRFQPRYLITLADRFASQCFYKMI